MKKNRFILCTIIFISIFFNSCAKKEREVISQGEVNLIENNENISESEIKTQTFHADIKKIAVLFGYGFNSKNFVEETLKNLSSSFGLSEDDGLIFPLIYPDDFKNGSKSNISLLRRKLSELDLQGILILGSPEGTCANLTRHSDSFGGFLPFPIISAFSQDDVLTTEYISTIVIDKEFKAELSGSLSTEEEQTLIPNIQDFIQNSIRFMKNADLPIKKDSTLIEFVKVIANQNKVSRYIDSETGLYSINHFYIQ